MEQTHKELLRALFYFLISAVTYLVGAHICYVESLSY